MSAMIEVRDLWKRFAPRVSGIKERIVGARKHVESKYARDWALQEISFKVEKGSAFGIVGHNGTGKSTLLSILLGTIPPNQGLVHISGRVASLLELGAGFHPELTGRENIYLYGSILGMTIGEVRERFERIVEFSELAGAIENPIRTYSSGMITRLGFSIIINAPADILLIDEVLAVGDSNFQKKCKAYLHDFKAREGTLVIVSHDIDALAEICDQGMCLDMGKVVGIGSIKSILAQYVEVIAS